MKAVYIYSDDWLSSKDIRAMSANQERGFFRLLLSQSAEVNGKLVYDDVEIGRLTLMGTKGWRKFKNRFSHLLSDSEGFIWNSKQYEGWIRHEKNAESGSKGGKRKAQNASQNASQKQPEAASKQPTRLKDLKTTTSQSQEKDSLSQPVEGDSWVLDTDGNRIDLDEWKLVESWGAEEGNPMYRHDNLGQAYLRKSKGGSRTEAGSPPICVECRKPIEGKVVFEQEGKYCFHSSCLVARSAGTDSHEPGQPPQAQHRAGLAKAQAGLVTQAAPLHGAGVSTAPRPVPARPNKTDPAPTPPREYGPGPVEQRANEFGELAIREADDVVRELREAERDGPTEEPLFNRLHARFTSKRIGGSCKHLNMALQQFMSLREALILKSRWSPIAFEESWFKNGWDAAFAAGRQAGELQYWLRDYDPDGTVQWKGKGDEKSGAKDDPRPLPIHEKCGKSQGTCECFDEDPEVSSKFKSDVWKKRNPSAAK